MSKTNLKKRLLTLSKEQVDDIVLQLYSASNEAKAWLEFYLEPNSDAMTGLRSRIFVNATSL